MKKLHFSCQLFRLYDCGHFTLTVLQRRFMQTEIFVFTLMSIDQHL